MSDYGIFEADEAAANEPRRQARTAARHLDAAINEVRRGFGRFLMGATGIDEFEDRWHLSKADIRAKVEPHVFPNTGTMRRIQNAMKADWKLAHPYKVAGGDLDAPFVDVKETFSPDSGNLVPEGDFEGYKDSVDQGGPEKVQRVLTPGDDTGTDKSASRRQAADHLMRDRIDQAYENGGRLDEPLVGVNPGDGIYRNHPGLLDGYDEGDYLGSQYGYDAGSDPDFVPADYLGPAGRDLGGKHRAEAAKLVADIYTDFAQANGLRVASLDTLDRYASTGIHNADYELLQNLIVAACECDDEDDDKEAPKASESDSDDDSDDDSEAPDFGGDDDAEGSDEGSEDDDDSDEDDSDSDSDSDSDDADDDWDFAADNTGDDDPGMGDAGGQQYTVPEQAPDLEPQMLDEIPHDDPQGAAPVPPEVIDSLLGLPEGTIEQLLLEEVQQGQGGGDGFGGPPQGGPPPAGPEQGGAPQEGGGDDFFGGGGDEPEPPQDPRVARRRQANGVAPQWMDDDAYDRSHPENLIPNRDTDIGNTAEDSRRNYRNESERSRKSQAARSFWAAEDEQSGGDSGGGAPTAPPAQDPAAAGGQPPMDPNAMGGMQQPMLPPPGSQSVAPPPPAAPMENQPAEDQLLDTANQAIMQMIDQQTQQYQQIIDPLSQALQAIQFAQQVEGQEHPMNVTPPQGTVDVAPSAAPGGAQNPNPLQPTASRQDKARNALRGAARVIANKYRLSATGERMLLEAMGRRNYEHVREALSLVPPEVRKPAAIHMGEMFAADNARFNKDAWMKSVLASNPRDRAGDAWRDGRDRGVAEHGRQDAEDEGDEYTGPHYREYDGYEASRRASRGRHPFDQARLAGPTLAPLPTMDAFEFSGQGQTPHVSDNLTIDDGKKLPGQNTHQSAKIADILHNLQTFLKGEQAAGRSYGGDVAAEGFLTKHPKIGPRGQATIHQQLGVEPHPEVEAPAPKVTPPKAINPVTKKASFFTRKVSGWKWDDHLSGYLSKEARNFTCSCGEHIPAPSYKNCKCGKIWNIYALGDSHHLASDTADLFIAREIPVRNNVIMANKKLVEPAQKSQRELIAEIDKLADWTIYDDEDPARQGGPKKPPSTKVPTGDAKWHSRNSDGKYLSPAIFAPKKK